MFAVGDVRAASSVAWRGSFDEGMVAELGLRLEMLAVIVCI
jgi:hypothetical protein